MPYTQFADQMLVCLYQETEQADVQRYFHLPEIVAKYGLKANKSWFDRLADDWQAQGLAERHYDSETSTWACEITGKGMRQVEAAYDDGDGVGIVIPPTEPITDWAQYFGIEPSDRQLHDSSAWTGLPSGFELDESRQARLVACLTQAEKDLDRIGASNEVKSQVQAYIVAMRALAEAPEPQVDIIWEIVNRANALAGPLALFVSIIALFKH